MKKLLVILVFSLFLVTPSQADDIKDFKIEGMSLRASALDYFSKYEIESSIKDKTTFHYKDSKYAVFGVYDRVLNNYTSLGITVKKNDKKFPHE